MTRLRAFAALLFALLLIAAPLQAMLLLTATTSSIEVVLGGAITTSQLSWTASFADITTTTFTPGSANGATNSTTAVTMVAAPAASTQRQVKLLTIYNGDTVSETVTVQYNANGTLRPIVKAILPVGYSLLYTDGHGFVVTDVNGAIQTSSSGSAPSDAQYWLGASSASLANGKNLGALSTGLVLNTSGVPSAYGGSACTNQFARSLNASGAATCASVSLTADVTGRLPLANLVQGTALSVAGVTGNSTADFASIVAASDFQVLRRSGTAVAFGSVNLASTAAVTGVLPMANGGTDNASASDDQILINSGTAWVAKSVPDCTDTGGNHLNYTASTNAVSCGTSGGGSSKLTTYTATLANVQDTATETTILSFVATANTWADGDFVYVDWSQLIKTNDGGTGTIAYKVNAGAGAQVTLGSPGYDLDANEYNVTRQFIMRRNGSTVWISQAIPVSFAGNGTNSGAIIGTSTPTNFTTDFTVSVKVTFSSATATKYIKPQNARIWKIAQ